jgi:hypothetical protein
VTMSRTLDRSNPFSANNETAALMIKLRVYSAGRVIGFPGSNGRLNQACNPSVAKMQLFAEKSGTFYTVIILPKTTV